MNHKKKQFCKHGHDTFVVGRIAGRCHTCYREQRKVNYRKYYAAHREKCKAASRKWGAANKGKRNAAHYRWLLANPDKAREIKRKRADKIIFGRKLYKIFGTADKKKLPQELINIGVLYLQLRKELRNGQST